ncbi:unnamed protein product [Vitrella brassicaformis CCMP3155]|uniref:CBS domain-containing protein n=1 Tax=Vitrella brassicaformis (strain CCMP3155) TaxID=1169540 RepID=A0A0G4F6F2_VITBC|nr:unnamed protein product [Vitrella brassicaformis CCMP3155]|eukprot:CEM07994.1 unnamed protein product [Vitrella brassicaformis CCMP3155]
MDSDRPLLRTSQDNDNQSDVLPTHSRQTQRSTRSTTRHAPRPANRKDYDSLITLSDSDTDEQDKQQGRHTPAPQSLGAPAMMTDTSPPGEHGDPTARSPLPLSATDIGPEGQIGRPGLEPDEPQPPMDEEETAEMLPRSTTQAAVGQWRQHFVNSVLRADRVSPTTSPRIREMFYHHEEEAHVPTRTSSQDFATVDWRHDRVAYARRQQELEHFQGFCATCRVYLVKAEGWIFCAAIGFMAAVSAAYIEVAGAYFADLRIGICRGMFWMDRRYCCGSDFAVDFAHNRCLKESEDVIDHHDHPNEFDHTSWLSWATVLGINEHNYLAAYLADYLVYVIIAIVMACIAAWLVRSYAKAASGSGIPEVKTILGGFVMKGTLGAWTLAIKCVGLGLAVASGLALGKEGPLVHVACCWANLLSRLSLKYHDNEMKKRELISAAAAAGVSVAFGAPLGGVLFSLEEVSTYFPPKTLWKSFFCAVVAALTLKWIDPRSTGALTMFQIDYISLLGTYQIIELIPFALLGLMGGLLGALFIHLNIRWSASKRNNPTIQASPVLEMMILTLCTAVINYLLPMMRGPASVLLEQLFGRCGSTDNPDMFSMCSKSTDSFTEYDVDWGIFLSLFAVMVLRFVQAVFTFGSPVPAGLFIPSLTIGACFGRLVGLLMIRLNNAIPLIQECHKCIQPGIYAMVGAAAMLGGVTRMTISLVVIMFELTGGLSYIVPFMISVMISKWVGDAFFPGVYDCYIRLKGYPYLESSADVTFTARACDIMEDRLVVITLEGNTIASLQQKLTRYSFSGYPLVSTRKDMILLGYIASKDLANALDKALENPEVRGTTMCRFLKYSRVLGMMSAARARARAAAGATPLSVSFAGRAASVVMTPSPRQLPTAEDLVSYGGEPFVDLSDIVDEHIIQLVPETPLGQIYNMFRQLGLRFCLLTRHGKLEGILTKKTFLTHMELAHPADLPNIHTPLPYPTPNRRGRDTQIEVTADSPAHGPLVMTASSEQAPRIIVPPKLPTTYSTPAQLTARRERAATEAGTSLPQTTPPDMNGDGHLQESNGSSREDDRARLIDVETPPRDPRRQVSEPGSSRYGGSGGSGGGGGRQSDGDAPGNTKEGEP